VAALQAPKLVAPATLVSGWTVGGGGSGASFDSTLAPAGLLDSFTAQLSNEGWSPLAKTASGTLGSATYARMDSDGKMVEVLLSVNRRSKAAKGYTALIAVTNISDPAVTAIGKPEGSGP